MCKVCFRTLEVVVCYMPDGTLRCPNCESSAVEESTRAIAVLGCFVDQLLGRRGWGLIVQRERDGCIVKWGDMNEQWEKKDE